MLVSMVEQEQNIGRQSEEKESKKPFRMLVIEADGYMLRRSIFFVPYDEKTGIGHYYEYEDGSPVESEVLAGWASLGAIG